MSNQIQKFCKYFRKKVLQLTLQEMSVKTGVKLTTISAFENGRSNNIEHLNTYIDLCNDTIQEEQFVNGIKLALKKESKQ